MVCSARRATKLHHAAFRDIDRSRATHGDGIAFRQCGWTCRRTRQRRSLYRRTGGAGFRFYRSGHGNAARTVRPAASAPVPFAGCGGVDALVQRIRAARYQGVIGVNIGKNADTPLEHAARDYLYCLERVYPVAHYVTVNISSPNTQGLRQLQDKAPLDALLAALQDRRRRLADQHRKNVPLALKIAPDLDDAQIRIIADTLLRHRVDGVIATNTTSA